MSGPGPQAIYRQRSTPPTHETSCVSIVCVPPPASARYIAESSNPPVPKIGALAIRTQQHRTEAAPAEPRVGHAAVGRDPHERALAGVRRRNVGKCPVRRHCDRQRRLNSYRRIPEFGRPELSVGVRRAHERALPHEQQLAAIGQRERGPTRTNRLARRRRQRHERHGLFVQQCGVRVHGEDQRAPVGREDRPLVRALAARRCRASSRAPPRNRRSPELSRWRSPGAGRSRSRLRRHATPARGRAASRPGSREPRQRG